MRENNESKNIQILISSTLRIGVIIACVIALSSGIYYLINHGADTIPNYYEFHGAAPNLTTLQGIFAGACQMQAENWIQMSVIILLLTPIMRIVLSLFDFFFQRDWLYVSITAVVLLIIIANAINHS